jgi:hypothetical protein
MGLPLGLPTAESRMWDLLVHDPDIAVHRMRAAMSGQSHAYSVLPNEAIDDWINASGISMPDGIFTVAALYCGARTLLVGDRNVSEMGPKKVQRISSGLSIWELKAQPQPQLTRLLSVPACEKRILNTYQSPESKQANAEIFFRSSLESYAMVGSFENGTRHPLFIAASNAVVEIGGMPVKFPAR